MEKAPDKAVDPTSSNTNFRFERKFIFNDLHIEDIISNCILSNPFQFKEIYERRTVNNIYLDDTNLSMYKMNVEGVGIRKKYRLRWYGDQYDLVKKPTLEIKNKEGEVGYKNLFRLKDFDMDISKLSSYEVHKILMEKARSHGHSQLLLPLQLLSPTLSNSYERRYFLSDCGKFRMTIDYRMKFWDPLVWSNFSPKYTVENSVLELKYNAEDDDESRMISQFFDNRLSKNSKYVIGYDLIHS